MSGVLVSRQWPFPHYPLSSPCTPLLSSSSSSATTTLATIKIPRRTARILNDANHYPLIAQHVPARSDWDDTMASEETKLKRLKPKVWVSPLSLGPLHAPLSLIRPLSQLLPSPLATPALSRAHKYFCAWCSCIAQQYSLSREPRAWLRRYGPWCLGRARGWGA